jgi:hypothetical protein
MIDAKQAVLLAKAKAFEILNQPTSNLEEIERESYKGRDTWSITLSFPRDLSQLSGLGLLAANPLQYRRFLIDAKTGEWRAMKIREVASQ